MWSSTWCMTGEQQHLANACTSSSAHVSCSVPNQAHAWQALGGEQMS